MTILNFSGVSCADSQIYSLWTTGNTPTLFSTYSGITDDYYTVITPNYEGNTDGIQIKTSTSYSSCLNTADPITFYYYDCTPCGGGSTTVIRSVIPNLHTYGWIIKDQFNSGVCFTVDNISLSTTSNNITATYYDCTNCSAGYASSGLTVSGGYEQTAEACLSGQFGTLYIWGNNPDPSLDEPVFLDSNCTLPINGYNLNYFTNWNGPNTVQLNNSGTVQGNFACTCYFTSIINEKLPVSTAATKTCISNLEFIIQYSASTSNSYPAGCSGHNCNAAVYWLKGNGIKITGGSVSDGAVWLNNAGGIYDKLNYPVGISSGYNRYNSISADTQTATAIASTTTDGFISFTLDCAIIDFFPGQNINGWGVNQCHTASSFIMAKLNGNLIWSGCPANNTFSLNPCTGEIINNAAIFNPAP